MQGVITKYRVILSPSGISDLCGTVARIVTQKGSISIGREPLQVFLFTRRCGVLAGFTARGSCDEKWRGQGIRKRSVF
jgi:hypothetical protein